MTMLPTTNYQLPTTFKRGQAALSFVFLVGIIILSIGVTVAFLAASFLNSGYGFQAGNKAMALASAGIEDALIKLVRNKDFSSVSPYSVPIGNDSASVTINQNSPISKNNFYGNFFFPTKKNSGNCFHK